MSTQPRPFYRAYPAMVQRTGPRQLSGRLVPYDTVADVLDELPDGRLDIYQEGFRRGAFAPQANGGKGIVNKISLVHQHDSGGRQGLGFLGPFTSLREEPDGLYGDVTVMPSLEDNVQALIESGIDELSIEFRLPKQDHTVEVDGVRWRVRAHLDQVALEPKGAYSQARVLQYRAEMDEQRRAEAEAEAQRQAEEAERQRLEQEQAEKDAEAKRIADAMLEEAEERRSRREQFERLAAKFSDVAAKQQELVREYGVTQPGSRS